MMYSNKNLIEKDLERKIYLHDLSNLNRTNAELRH